MQENATETQRHRADGREKAGGRRGSSARGAFAARTPQAADGLLPSELLCASASLWQFGDELTARLKKLFPSLAVYLAIILAATTFTAFRLSGKEKSQSMPAAAPAPEDKNENEQPVFSLTSSRTYASTDRARVWLNYKGIDQIDFRVYRIKDPAKFFKQLDDPHQMGDKDKAEAMLYREPTALETLRAVKDHLYNSLRDYVRAQVRYLTRKTFNQKIEKSHADNGRRPLNVADYARVPLLNPDQMVSSWREQLQPLAQHDRRQIPLGEREPGVYLVEAVGGGDQRAYSIAIVTDMVMVNKTTPEGEVLVYAVNRKTGQPRPGVNVEVVKNKQTLAHGTTDEGGILKTKVAKQKRAAANGEEEPPAEDEDAAAPSDSYIVMATDKENFAISDLDSFYFSQYYNDEINDETLTGYLYTDRPIYRPGHKVYFKGILRRLSSNGYSMIDDHTVTVTIADPNDAKLYEQEVQLSSRGTFNGEFDLPEETPLGNYHLTAQVGEATTSYYFQVEEYKKPEYKVKVSASKKYIANGGQMKFEIEARYFFGSPVANADIKYYIHRSRYYPYWWRDEGEDGDELGIDEESDAGESDYYGYDGGDVLKEEEGKLDANGRMTVEFDVPQPKEDDAWDYEYTLDAQVTDDARRTIDGQASFIGTRGNIVARAYPTNYVYFTGDTARIDVKSADYEGHPVPARVTLQFIERRWEKVMKKEPSGYEYETYEVKEGKLSSVELRTSASGEATYDYPVSNPGSVYIKTTVHEDKKDVISPGGYMWVADRTNEWKDYSYEDYGSIKLIPDKKSYHVGETAHVLAMLKTDHANLLVTTELMSVMSARHVEAKGRAVIIDVPIEARYEPNVYLNVSYVEDNELYTEEQMLVVPARDKLLDLSIIPNKKEYRPRDTASYTILARNSDGTPAAGAEISLGVVDEAIYSLASESAGNIRREFYGRRYHQVQTTLTTSFRFTGYSGDKPIGIAERTQKPSYQLADFKNEDTLVDPTVRRNFKDTAFWQPNAVTGADGKATVKFKLPDNLTTWRATARAVTADTRVGSTTENVVARKDLILRLETPRFVTDGDTVTLSGIVHNYLNADKQTQVSLQIVGGAQIIGQAKEAVLIQQQGQHRTDWRVTAQQTGEMKLLAKALTDKESDAVEISINVLPRGLKQTKAQSATLSQETATQDYSFDIPASSDADARNLRIEAAPSVASALFGALDYLTGYPYGCTEQTMSRFLPTVIVAQTLKDVKTTRIKETNNIGAKVQSGLDRLYSFQHTDGGWGWWKEDETDPFMTAYVVDGLTLAKNAGYQIEDYRLTHAREKLKQMLDENKAHGNQPIDLESRAYMIYAMTESGETDAKYVDDLFARRGELQPYGRALLALTLNLNKDETHAHAVAAEIESSATVNELDAHWDSRRREMLDFSEVNDTEATALSLKALARINPQSPVMPKAARWLVSNRRNGYWWDSTKQTAFAIFGLTDYLKVSQELTPDYTVEVYLNGEQILNRHVTTADAAGAQSFVVKRKGREVGAVNRVRVVKRGRGMLYFSGTLDYYTGEEETQAQGNAQLQLTREYLRLTIDESSGTPQWKLEPLTGEVVSGDMIVVRLKLTGARAQRLMIEDPIPAGCEQMTRASSLNLDYTTNSWSDWYSAREFRDEKTVFFLDQFDGDVMFQYAMRVQIPGEFRINPARVELMYTPQVQANTASARMLIKDK
ncbi:MAG TPA: MG2 domain-containing protein [Pyrinomonadaceae bacterium]